jgi:hypothetical protein
MNAAMISRETVLTSRARFAREAKSSGIVHQEPSHVEPRHGRKPSEGTRGGAERGKTGLSPEVWEAIAKALPGIISAIAELVRVLGLH